MPDSSRTVLQQSLWWICRYLSLRPHMMQHTALTLCVQEGAGRGTRDLAAAQPWTGAEQTEDAVLRMLSDAHPPLKGSRSPQLPVIRPPSAVKPRKRSSGHRLVNARDRSSVYAIAKGASLSEKEKDQMRRELKERFSPGARPMPTSVQGLASLANERIEDAIARGQFKNLPRGDIIQRDYNASSPFLDTTEYFMNKIIQKQEIVPPWIEKQQELVKAAAVFRGRLRADWKRHAARTIASKGGSLREQVKRAEAYAVAEASVAPRPPAERLKKGSIEALATMDDDEPALAAATAMDALAAVENDTLPVFDSSPPSQEPFTSDDASDVRAAQETRQPQPHPPPPTAILQPFRDPAWLAAEHSYLTLAVTTLNNQTRSYNLMAPDLAKKPYFSLDRELRACYADVAPLLPGEIHERARAPARREEAIGHRPGGVLERLGGDTARVWDDRRKPYGFREFWRDLWARG